MKKIFIIFSLITLMSWNGSVVAQKTTQRKEYYGYWNTKIKRIYYVNGSGNIQGEDKLYYESGKIKATQKWDNGVVTQRTQYFETGALWSVQNFIAGENRNVGEVDFYLFHYFSKCSGEQKFYKYDGSKHYLFRTFNVLDDEVIESKCFDSNGKIIEQYKKNAYYKSKDDEYTLKNGYLDGRMQYGFYLIDIKEGKLLSVKYPKDNYDGVKYLPYFEVVFEENYIKRTAVDGNDYYEFRLKYLPFSVADNKPVPFNLVYDCDMLHDYPQFYRDLRMDKLISPQLKNTVIDGVLTISNIDKNKTKTVKERRYYENGLLIQIQLFDGNWSYDNVYMSPNSDSLIVQFEYKKTFSLEHESEIKNLLKYDDKLKTHYVEPSEDDCIKTYKAFKHGNIIASTEMAKKQEEKEQEQLIQSQSQEILAGQRDALQKEFYDLIGGSVPFVDPGANIRRIFGTLKTEFEKELRKSDEYYNGENGREMYQRNPHYVRNYDPVPTKAEQATLYQSGINAIKKVGIKEFNKACKDIKTKEKLIEYLNNVNN